jgi:hypothetical protein
MKIRFATTAALAFGAASLLAGAARAADCTTLPSPVYVTGSSAAKGVLAKVAGVLASQNVTLVYLSQGSCVGVSTALNSTPTPYVGTGLSYWDTTGTVENKCDLAAPGAPFDVGISDVFAESCQPLPNGLPSFVTDFLGPVQAMTFVVPNTSSQKSISAEAAYFVFGFGMSSGVTPWTDETLMFVRSATSGTQAMIANAIQVPVIPTNKWKGVSNASSGAVVAALNTINGMGTPAQKEAAIGILAADVADANRTTLRELAYRHFGQNCGYLPDSASNKFDKRNVRDGHYAIWGPLHILKRSDTNAGNQMNVQLAVDYIIGAKEPPGVDLIAFEASSHVIPQCAMRVKRTQEVGPMVPFTPSKPCGCYYEYNANTVSTCQTCQKAADCPSGYSCPVYNGMGWCEPP